MNSLLLQISVFGHDFSHFNNNYQFISPPERSVSAFSHVKATSYQILEEFQVFLINSEYDSVSLEMLGALGRINKKINIAFYVW